MPEIRFETLIEAPAEAVFAAIVDLPGYAAWLPNSKEYAGTTEISTDQVGVGTTYVENSPGGVRRGTVTEFEAPRRVRFHQPMTLKPKMLGTIDIDVTYTLTPAENSVQLLRVVTLRLPVMVKPVQPLVVRRTRAEIERTVLALKAFVEGQR